MIGIKCLRLTLCPPASLNLIVRRHLMNRLPVTVGLDEDSDGVADPPSTVVIAVQVHGTIGHRFDYSVRVGCPQNRLRLRFAQRSLSALPSNNRFERSRVTSSVSQGGSR